jgi:hypothetical protein
MFSIAAISLALSELLSLHLHEERVRHVLRDQADLDRGAPRRRAGGGDRGDGRGGRDDEEGGSEGERPAASASVPAGETSELPSPAPAGARWLCDR